MRRQSEVFLGVSEWVLLAGIDWNSRGWGARGFERRRKGYYDREEQETNSQASHELEHGAARRAREGGPVSASSHDANASRQDEFGGEPDSLISPFAGC